MQLPQTLQGKSKGFYSYSASFLALAAGATASVPIQIDTDSDFFWMKGSYFVDVAGAAQTDSTRVVPLVRVLLTDGASGRQLMKEEQPIPALFGTGEIPYILPVAQHISAAATFNVFVRNYSAATAYANLYLVFSGLKVYRK